MKLDRKVITLAEADAAKEFAAESEWAADNSVIMCAANTVLQYYYNTDFYFMPEAMGKATLTVTKNHYKFTVWADLFVKYYYDGKDHVAKISMDVIESYNASYTLDDSEKACAFVIVYDEASHGTV